MKTIVLTVNSRASYGDGAKEAIVGVYQFHNRRHFNRVLGQALDLMRSGGWITPEQRPSYLRKLLMRMGYDPIKTGRVFAPIY
jgi:hypothetical protein